MKSVHSEGYKKIIMEQEAKEEIRLAHCFEYFHGEELYKCPWCQGVFEYYKAFFEHDCIKVPEYDGEVYRHKACGKLLRIS